MPVNNITKGHKWCHRHQMEFRRVCHSCVTARMKRDILIGKLIRAYQNYQVCKTEQHSAALDLTWAALIVFNRTEYGSLSVTMERQVEKYLQGL